MPMDNHKLVTIPNFILKYEKDATRFREREELSNRERERVICRGERERGTGTDKDDGCCYVCVLITMVYANSLPFSSLCFFFLFVLLSKNSPVLPQNFCFFSSRDSPSLSKFFSPFPPSFHPCSSVSSPQFFLPLLCFLLPIYTRMR